MGFVLGPRLDYSCYAASYILGFWDQRNYDEEAVDAKAGKIGREDIRVWHGHKKLRGMHAALQSPES